MKRILKLSLILALIVFINFSGTAIAQDEEVQTPSTYVPQATRLYAQDSFVVLIGPANGTRIMAGQQVNWNFVLWWNETPAANSYWEIEDNNGVVSDFVEENYYTVPLTANVQQGENYRVTVYFITPANKTVMMTRVYETTAASTVYPVYDDIPTDEIYPPPEYDMPPTTIEVARHYDLQVAALAMVIMAIVSMGMYFLGKYMKKVDLDARQLKSTGNMWVLIIAMSLMFAALVYVVMSTAINPYMNLIEQNMMMYRALLWVVVVGMALGVYFIVYIMTEVSGLHWMMLLKNIGNGVYEILFRPIVPYHNQDGELCVGINAPGTTWARFRKRHIKLKFSDRWETNIKWNGVPVIPVDDFELREENIFEAMGDSGGQDIEDIREVLKRVSGIRDVTDEEVDEIKKRRTIERVKKWYKKKQPQKVLEVHPACSISPGYAKIMAFIDAMADEKNRLYQRYLVKKADVSASALRAVRDFDTAQRIETIVRVTPSDKIHANREEFERIYRQAATRMDEQDAEARKPGNAVSRMG